MTSSQVYDLARDYLERDGLQAVSTGFRLLDKHLQGGFVPGSIYIVAGFPGEGKTSLCLSMARRLAFDQAKRVIYLSLEMSSRELIERALCQTTRKSLLDLQQLRLTGELASLMQPFLTDCSHAKFRIEDNRAATPTDLKLLLDEMSRSEDPPTQVLIIDHLQHQCFTEGLSRADAIANYMADLKAIAKRHHLIVIACSQINREARKQQRREVWNLKSSGAIEEAADAVLICEREGFDSPNVLPEDATESCEFKIRIAKHRRGPISELTLLFRPVLYEFEEPESGWTPKRHADEVIVVP